MDIIDQLRTERQNQGISLRTMAELTGLPKSTIVNVETRTTDPRLSNLIKIATTLGLTITTEPQTQNPK